MEQIETKSKALNQVANHINNDAQKIFGHARKFDYFYVGLALVFGVGIGLILSRLF